MTESRLSRRDYEEFLLYAYFGYGRDYLWLCVDRAYRDFNRTMRGFGTHEGKSEVHKQARLCVRQLLDGVREQPISTQEQFDQWHRQACQTLTLVYDQHGFKPFYVGQAQKWLNMSFKYIFTMGNERVPGFTALYPFCHVPLDNILVRQLAKYGFPPLAERWSRISSYDQYLSYQSWIREHFSSLPLDVEFLLWMGKTPG